MGPGKVTTEAGGWITTVESGHCRTQGSLQVSASGAGAATPQDVLHRLEQDIFRVRKHSWKTHRGLGKGAIKEEGAVLREAWRDAQEASKSWTYLGDEESPVEEDG